MLCFSLFMDPLSRIPDKEFFVCYGYIPTCILIHQFFEVIVYPLFIFRHHIVILLIIQRCYKCKRTCDEMQSTQERQMEFTEKSTTNAGEETKTERLLTKRVNSDVGKVPARSAFWRARPPKRCLRRRENQPTIILAGLPRRSVHEGKGTSPLCSVAEKRTA